jgi:hypothetical protein
MKKFPKEAVIIALLALIALPLQQILLKQTAKSVTAVKRSKFDLEENWSECALSGNGAGVILMADSNFKRNHLSAGENWLKFGVYHLQSPSVMLYYGDWLKQKGNPGKAEYLYRFALKKAVKANAPQKFISELKKRLGNNL